MDTELDALRTWLARELDDRGWSIRELARRAKISPAQIAGFLAGDRGIGIDTIKAISPVLEKPPVLLLEMAGMLPSSEAAEHDHSLRELYELAKRLSPQRRRELAEYAALQVKLQKEQEEPDRPGTSDLPPAKSNTSSR